MKRNIRLSEQELEAIIEVCEKHIKIPYELRLYGSRAREGTLGGDIDLLILSSKPIEKKILRRINIEIQDRIGVQKIDIVTSTYDSKNSFVELVKEESIKIWEHK